jgi:hypothetical protein
MGAGSGNSYTVDGFPGRPPGSNRESGSRFFSTDHARAQPLRQAVTNQNIAFLVAFQYFLPLANFEMTLQPFTRL